MSNQTHSYVRLYNDPEGESHFADVTLDLARVDYAPPAPAMSSSQLESATSWLLLKADAGWDGTWHQSPIRQFMIIMSGEVKVEVTDGEIRTFRPGDVILVEDLEGRGHYSTTPDGVECGIFVVYL